MEGKVEGQVNYQPDPVDVEELYVYCCKQPNCILVFAVLRWVVDP